MGSWLKRRCSGLLQNRPQSLEQGSRRIGFGQEVLDARAGSLGRIHVGVQSTCRYDLDGGIDLRQGPNGSRAIHNRHRHVGQDDGNFIPVLRVDANAGSKLRR